VSAAGGPVEGTGREVADLELVEDLTASSRCDEGFLRLRRLRMRTVYADGSKSAPYPVDVVSRREPDAVAVAVYAFRAPPGGGRPEVVAVLRRGVRPPVHLRRHKRLVQPDAAPRSTLVEVVAGILEPDDGGPKGIDRRAAAECLEEAGVEVAPEAVAPLGAESFPTPGVTDEKVHFRAVRADLARVGGAAGDGSAMEEAGSVDVLPLRDAIERCRTGAIPDMKTEVALLRLADHLGYVVGLDAFVEDLPAEWRARWRPAGVARAERGPGRP
jgi:ADP-ribose pyrophosphatase